MIEKNLIILSSTQVIFKRELKRAFAKAPKPKVNFNVNKIFKKIIMQ